MVAERVGVEWIVWRGGLRLSESDSRRSTWNITLLPPAWRRGLTHNGDQKARKGSDGTHLRDDRQYCSTARTWWMTGCHSHPAPPSLPQPDIPCDAKSGLTASKTVSTNSYPLGEAGLATMILTQQCACHCQGFPNMAHLTATPQWQRRPKVVRGWRWRKRSVAALQGPPT